MIPHGANVIRSDAAGVDYVHSPAIVHQVLTGFAATLLEQFCVHFASGRFQPVKGGFTLKLGFISGWTSNWLLVPQRDILLLTL